MSKETGYTVLSNSYKAHKKACRLLRKKIALKMLIPEDDSKPNIETRLTMGRTIEIFPVKEKILNIYSKFPRKNKVKFLQVDFANNAMLMIQKGKTNYQIYKYPREEK